ncbi:MAG TPA: endonuclease [Candidatus Coprenecus pullistercoris]|nr:endonuclease [Candidatus Coprenecus pullistercoris]
MRSWICVTVIMALFLTVGAYARNSRYIVFWNLENYFDPFDDSLTLDDEFTPDGYRRWTWNRFIAKRNLIAKTLLSMHDRYGDFPLMAAFAEVENRMVLRQLTMHTALAKLGYGIVHRDSPDSRGIDVALIYREEFFRVLEVETIGVLTGRERPTRDILHVTGILTAEGDTVHVFVNHWPSKFGGEEYSRPFRQAASDTLCRAVLALSDSLAGELPAVVVTGDFNDTPDSPPVRSLVAATGLLNLSNPLHEAGRGTLKYNGRWELIDHFLVSAFLEGSVMEIYSHHMLLEEDSKYLGVKPRRSFYGPVWHGGASDHLPIVLLLPSVSQASDRYE